MRFSPHKTVYNIRTTLLQCLRVVFTVTPSKTKIKTVECLKPIISDIKEYR